MKALKAIFMVMTIGLLLACEDKTEWEQSIFIEDEQAPGLPIQSDYGYNTFGAYYDQKAFISNNYSVPLRVIVEAGITKFQLEGRIENKYYSNDEWITFSFVFHNFNPDQYQDIVSLNDQTIDLTQSTYSIEINSEPTDVISGELRVNHARELVVDDDSIGIILSGTFELQLLVDGDPVQISSGRFDLNVNETNFWLID